MDPDRISPLYGLKRFLRKGHSEDIFTQFLQLGGYSGVAALVFFVLHLFMARTLGPIDYASYGTFTAILFTVLLTFSSIYLIVTRLISYHKSRFQYEQINYLVAKSLRILFIAGFVLFFIILFFAPAIGNFFSLEDGGVVSTVILGMILWFTMLVPVYEGAFKGLEDFVSLGRFRITEASIRLVLGVVLVLLGFGLHGALFALGIGTFLALALSYRKLHRVLKLKVARPDLSALWRFAIPVLFAMASLSLLLNVDIILVKHYFPAAEAGVFAAASLLSKLPFFVAFVLVGVMFPKITVLHADGKNSVPILKNALQFLAPLIAILTILAFFFANPLFRLFFGPQYAIGPVLGFYVFGMGCLAIALILAVYLLAIRKEKPLYALPFFLILLVLLLVWLHGSLLTVMIVVMLVMALVAAYMLYAAREELEFDYFI